jgi:transposase
VARQQLGKFLLRNDLRYNAGVNWTKKHLNWVRRLRVKNAVQQVVLDDYFKAVEDATERVERLTGALEEKILASSLAPLVRGFQVLRGVATVTAATLAAEIGDFRRFRTAGQFMAYVGLTPTEDSSGERVRRGAISKCGNRHVRHLLVEAAQHYRRRPAVSCVLRKRSADQPDALRQIGWEAQNRLHRRLTAVLARGKPGNKAITAVARELAGFVWAIGREVAIT